MAYRCNPCRHTSAPFPIARSEWDMKQNAHFCPDCQSDYTLATNKYPNPPSPKSSNCGCKPCYCKKCDFGHQGSLIHVGPCFPPHPAVVPPHVVPVHPHPVVPHPVVPHNPISPPHVTPVPKADAKAVSFFF